MHGVLWKRLKNRHIFQNCKHLPLYQGVVSGAAKFYVCRALGPRDLDLPGRRPRGATRGEPAAVGRAGQPPLPPEGATGCVGSYGTSAALILKVT